MSTEEFLPICKLQDKINILGAQIRNKDQIIQIQEEDLATTRGQIKEIEKIHASLEEEIKRLRTYAGITDQAYVKAINKAKFLEKMANSFQEDNRKLQGEIAEYQEQIQEMIDMTRPDSLGPVQISPCGNILRKPPCKFSKAGGGSGYVVFSYEEAEPFCDLCGADLHHSSEQFNNHGITMKHYD